MNILVASIDLEAWQYVIAGYAVVFGVIGLYALWIIRRGKKLSAKVPADKRWFLE